jgi:hypothetical protein
MSEDSASSQELHVAREVGGQGGNSLLQQNFSSSLTIVHAVSRNFFFLLCSLPHSINKLLLMSCYFLLCADLTCGFSG